MRKFLKTLWGFLVDGLMLNINLYCFLFTFMFFGILQPCQVTRYPNFTAYRLIDFGCSQDEDGLSYSIFFSVLWFMVTISFVKYWRLENEPSL